MKLKGKGQLNGFLDAGSHLDGELKFEDTFRIDGRLTGKVDCDGDLYVGEQGHVHGEIKVAKLFVSGRVEGSVHAGERIEIAAGAQVRAELVTPLLVIEEGAFFDGSAKMVERAEDPVRPKVAALAP
jgi:cytoskeletal protein CcmA (bactofilin family)